MPLVDAPNAPWRAIFKGKLLPGWQTMTGNFPVELEPLRDRCLYKDYEACAALAAIVDQGKLVPRNPELVSGILEDCCMNGGGMCCATKGDHYNILEESTGFPRTCWWKHSVARTYYQRGCALGSSRACGELGALLTQRKCVEDLEGASKAFQEGVSLATKGCYEKESAAECQELRKILLKRAQFDSAHAQEDEDRAAAAAEAALRILERRCTDSDPSGCGQLGDYLMSRFKDGVASAVARARTAYERGCNRDKTTCCESLGEMYESGTPATPQDREIALAYFARSCRLEAQSCLRLSHFYEDHPELLPPHSETFPQTLLSYACLAGNMLACALMRQKHIEQKKKLPLIG